ncbi:hypothetical protein OG921_12780 [Aldersonia sp. NBC_00410]|uniref:DUF6578 domain-containing protein n=1 Tax=Aldersonia sp. NBC_00410 TaxID=2975954 RepID=UPI002250A777|nr:DUF6578 domain-containing protein [Aldersonia sp. NBC_00410]MCX5044044.1 hypothetical protein [Aldersonia sp. NBC_00410]
MVDGWTIEDGGLDPPAVGAVLSTWLVFQQGATPDRDHPEASALWAVADPLIDRSPTVGRDGRPDWTIILRGDGWSAIWHTERPVIGQVEVTGTLSVDCNSRAHAVRGRITRVRLITTTIRRVDDARGGWKAVPGTRRYTDIDTAPRWFEKTTDLGDGDVVDRHIGVLVELDLDDVPPAALRPRIWPGAVSGFGTDLWILDRELPVLARVREAAHAPVVSEHVFPAPALATGPWRRVFADSGGCWITGIDGVFRCVLRPDGSVESRRSDDRAAWRAVSHGDILLAVDRTLPGLQVDAQAAQVIPVELTERPARILRPDAPTVPVDLPDGAVQSLIATATGFAVLLRIREPNEGTVEFRIATVTLDGQVSVGSGFWIEERHAYPVFALDDPLLLLTRRSIFGVGDDSTAALVHTFPRPVLPSGGQAGHRIWLTMHRPDGTGGWWPVRGPADLPPRDAGKWLLALLDPVTLEPTTVIAVNDSQPGVTTTGDGSIWITDHHGIRVVHPDGTLQPLNLSDDPATP